MTKTRLEESFIGRGNNNIKEERIKKCSLIEVEDRIPFIVSLYVSHYFWPKSTAKAELFLLSFSNLCFSSTKFEVHL